jgi:hypothetical protein
MKPLACTRSSGRRSRCSSLSGLVTRSSSHWTTHPQRSAGHGVQQQQPAARPQHPLPPGDGAPLVGDGEQREGADHGVEAGIVNS